MQTGLADTYVEFLELSRWKVRVVSLSQPWWPYPQAKVVFLKAQLDSDEEWQALQHAHFYVQGNESAPPDPPADELAALVATLSSTEDSEVQPGPQVGMCDQCMSPLYAGQTYAISARGGIPTDPSPEGSPLERVYRLVCEADFIDLYRGHGNQVTEEAKAQSRAVAQEHLRLTGRL